jgi:hypothetical protein
MKVIWIGAVLLGTLALGNAEEAPKIEYKPLSIAALEEFGVLQSGRFGGKTETFTDEWVDHFGAFITQQVVIGENLTFNIGLGGLFQFQKPEVVNAAWGGTQYKNFFVGPTVAEAVYKSASENGSWSLGTGMFPFKYNPNVSNLGEYLFRSGPYPNYIMSGGYAFVGDNQAYLQGMKMNFTRGGFSADLLLLTETGIPPLYDLSLAALLKYSVAEGLLDMTAGAHFKRLLPVHPSRTTRQTRTNSYFDMGGRTYTGKVSYYFEQSNFYGALAAEATLAGNAALAAQHTARQDAYRDTATMVTNWTNPDSAAKYHPGYNYYTQQGVILMAGLALDLKKIITSDVFGPQDLKLYTEAALLGVKDYPIFYEDKAQRMPIMVGFNFPGFKILDLISLEVEYFNSPWINSYEESGSTNEATPALPQGSDRLSSKTAYNDVTTRDNYSWSVLIRKELVRGLNVSGQVARDHIRSVSESFYSGPGIDPNELLRTSKDWYWMLQFSVGI